MKRRCVLCRVCRDKFELPLIPIKQIYTCPHCKSLNDLCKSENGKSSEVRETINFFIIPLAIIVCTILAVFPDYSSRWLQALVLALAWLAVPAIANFITALIFFPKNTADKLEPHEK